MGVGVEGGKEPLRMILWQSGGRRHQLHERESKKRKGCLFQREKTVKEERSSSVCFGHEKFEAPIRHPSRQGQWPSLERVQG